MKKILLATSNAGKLREMQALLAGRDIDVVAQSALKVPDADETGATFIENAILKARNAAQYTGLPAIADDSGLAVDALGGAPGVRSARYAGEPSDDAANNAKLLAALAGVPFERRTARFQCVMVFIHHAEDPVPLIAQGVWEGLILEAPRGSAGFGYDPLFLVPEKNSTVAELDADLKNRLSHRGQALRALVAQLA